MTPRVLHSQLLFAIVVALSTTNAAFAAEAPVGTAAPTLIAAPSTATQSHDRANAVVVPAAPPPTAYSAVQGTRGPSVPTGGPAAVAGASTTPVATSDNGAVVHAVSVPPTALPAASSAVTVATVTTVPAARDTRDDAPLPITRTILSADWPLKLHLEPIRGPSGFPAPAGTTLAALVQDNSHAQDIASPPGATPAPAPTVPSESIHAVQLASIEVRPSADAIALMHAQTMMAELQTNLAVAHDQVQALTIERDAALADVVTAQTQTRAALAQVDNQRGLTAIALHQEGRAVQAFADAAAHGDMTAAANLALLLIDGRGVERNVPRAIGLLEQAAGQGNAMAARNLSTIYKSGIGVFPDSDRAWQWESVARRIDAAGADLVQSPVAASPR